MHLQDIFKVVVIFSQTRSSLFQQYSIKPVISGISPVSAVVEKLVIIQVPSCCLGLGDWRGSGFSGQKTFIICIYFKILGYAKFLHSCPYLDSSRFRVELTSVRIRDILKTPVENGAFRNWSFGNWWFRKGEGPFCSWWRLFLCFLLKSPPLPRHFHILFRHPDSHVLLLIFIR